MRLFRMLRHRRAVTAIEYGLIAAGIIVAALIAISTTGQRLDGVFNTIAGSMAGRPADVIAGPWTAYTGSGGIYGSLYSSTGQYVNANGVYAEMGSESLPNEFRVYNGGTKTRYIPINGQYLAVVPGAQLDINWSWLTQWPSNIMIDYNKTPTNSPETALVNSYCRANGGTVTQASTSGGSTPSCELPNGSVSTLQIQSAMGVP